MMRFNGPDGAMMIGPDRMFREQIEPLVRQRMRDLPNKVQPRSPTRFKTLAPSEAPAIFNVESGDAYWDTGDLLEYEDEPMLDLDDDLFDIEKEIDPVSSDVIRELAASAIRDAQSALRQLAAEQVA
jgi:hypothetical protein